MEPEKQAAHTQPQPQMAGSQWLARYEVAVRPQDYPRVHALLQQKGAFAEDFSVNLERLAQEYLEAVEQHLKEQAEAEANTQASPQAAPTDGFTSK